EDEAAKVAGPTVPCPMCDAPVAIDATRCESCGVRFALTRKLEEDLDDRGHAAIQEMVQEELGGAPTAPVPTKPPAKPDVEVEAKPLPKRVAKPARGRGLTNGLLRRRGASRQGGKTNGPGGRTNGLRGKTNGLTNGRTNGLTNGLRCIGGPTYGPRRADGLANGPG